MITSTTAFAEKVEETSRRFSAKFLLNGSALDCSFKTLVIHKGCAAADDGFTIGTCYSSYIEAVVSGLTDSIQNEELQLQIGVVLDDESIDYVTIGYYTVTQPKKTTNTKTFTAYGPIASKFGIAFTPPQTASIANIASALATQTGVSVTLSGISNTSLTITESLEGLTCYDALAVLATAAGGFATETASGGVIVTKYSTTNTVAVQAWEMHAAPQFDESDYEVTGVKVVVSEASEDENGTAIPEVSYQSGMPNLFISSPYVTNSIFTNILAPNIIDYEFRPAAVTVSHGDPRLEATDTLLIPDGDVVHAVPCHDITITYDGGISVGVTAYGGSESDDDSASPRPITQKLNQYAADLVTVKKAIIDRAKITDLQATNAQVSNLQATKAYIDTLVASNITANTLIADAATIASLSTNYLKVDATNIGSAVINKIYGDYGLITNLQIVNGKVTGSLAAVTIDGDLITANTIVANRLIYSGTDGVYYELNANAGTLTPQQLTDSKYRSALDGSVIVASSITADQIAAGTITATQIATATITAAKINMNDLQANIARIGNMSGEHVQINNNSVDIKNGNTLQARLSGSGTTIYADDGVTETARFSGDGAMIGDQTGRRIEISDKSMKLFNEDSVENMAIDAIVTSSQEIEQVVFSSAERDDDDAGTYIWTIPLKQTPVTGSPVKFIYGDGVHEYTFTYGTAGTVTYTGTWATGRLTYDGNRTFTAVATYDPAPTMSEEEEYDILLMVARIQYIAAVTQTPTFAFGLGTTAGENGFTIGKFNSDTYNNQRAFAIGNGTGYNSKSTLLYVSWDGTLAMDGDITATGKITSNSSAFVGGDATVLGDVSVTGNITPIGTIGLAGSIKRKTYTWTISSIGANEYKSTEVSPPSESGYTPIGIIGKGIDGTGTASALWVKYYIRSSDNKLVIGIKNDNATARTNWTATVYILYVKS